MLAIPASTHKRIHSRVLPPSSRRGGDAGALLGPEDGPFELDRGPDDGERDGGDFDGDLAGVFADGFVGGTALPGASDGATGGGAFEPGVSGVNGAGGPDASSVSLDGSFTMARGELDGSGGTLGAVMAGMVTANASVPAGEVANAAGLSDSTSSGRARACMIAALSADADG